MDTTKGNTEKPSSLAASVTSCRKKKSEEATFLEDVKDHIDEFIHASMDEHKSCFKKTVQKVCVKPKLSYLDNCVHHLVIYIVCGFGLFQMFGMSKAVAERNTDTAKEVESSLPLQTTLQG